MRVRPTPETGAEAAKHRRRAPAGSRDCSAAFRTAAGARIADEISDVGPVGAFDHAHAAIHQRSPDVACRLHGAAHKAAVSPFPHIAGHVDEPMLVDPERADRLRLPDALLAL